MPIRQLNEEEALTKNIPNEPVNKALLGQPTVSIRGLKKTFDTQIAVNEIHFDMFPNQVNNYFTSFYYFYDFFSFFC